MPETWDETKKRLEKLGIKLPEPDSDIKIEVVQTRKVQKELPNVPLYEVRKITLPPDKAHEHGKVVVYGVTAAEADWFIERKLKTKVYQDDRTDMKTLVFYEKFLVDGTPKERNIYSNPVRFCTEEFPGLNAPRRIN